MKQLNLLLLNLFELARISYTKGSKRQVVCSIYCFYTDLRVNHFYDIWYNFALINSTLLILIYVNHT